MEKQLSDSKNLSAKDSLELRSIIESRLLLAKSQKAKPCDMKILDEFELLKDSARNFPDIAQVSANELNDFSIFAARKLSGRSESNRFSSRYVITSQEDGSEKQSDSTKIYHVELLHGGATAVVSKASRFQGRIIHDPFFISPDEFDNVKFSFLKTAAFFDDPIENALIRSLKNTPETFQKLSKWYFEKTGNRPFEAVGSMQTKASIEIIKDSFDPLQSSKVSISYKSKKRSM